MADEPSKDEINSQVIAGRDDKGKPMTQEQVEERTRKKLEADAEKSEKVKEELKKEAEEATKAAEKQAKEDEEFKKKQAKGEKAEKAEAPSHPPPQGGRSAAHR